MFIVSITYKVELNQVDNFLDEHIMFLKQEYKNKNFILSGRKEPRTGGIIISPLKSQADLEKVLNKDPFKRENLANYNIIEFTPSMFSDELEFLKP
jgi:uncharacterized protein YciI